MLKPTFQWGMQARTGKTCAKKCTFISDVRLVEASPEMVPEEDLG
jgi:hypothetical protein